MTFLKGGFYGNPSKSTTVRALPQVLTFGKGVEMLISNHSYKF